MAKKAKKSKKTVPAKVETTGPFQEMERRIMEMEKRFEDFFPDRWLQPFKGGLPEWPSFSTLEFKTPKVDIIDRDNEILVRADIR